VPLLINWVIVPIVIWLTAVALLAGGVVGAVLRWPELAWLSGTHPIRRAIGIGATLVSCTLLIGVAVILIGPRAAQIARPDELPTY